MRKIVVFVCAFICLNAFAQETSTTKIELDYIVDYTINSGKDYEQTLKVGYDKSGRYIWTDFEMFKTLFVRSLQRRGQQNMFKDGKMHFIYDSETLQLYFHFQNKSNTMFMKLNIEDVLPQRRKRNIDEESDPKEVKFIAEKTKEKVTVLGKKHKIHLVYPSNETHNKLSVVFDKKYDVKNSHLFKGIFTMAMENMDGNKVTSVDLPDGLILYVKNKDEELLKATAVNKTNKTITINHSIEVKE